MALSFPIPPSFQESINNSKVEYVQVGSSGLRVSWPILGAMTLGASAFMPWNLDENASIELLKAAYDRGLNTWDTANTYGNGESEKIIAKALRVHQIPRHKVVIMTKCFFHVGEEADVFAFALEGQINKAKDYVNQGGLSRSAIFSQVEASLARLDTPYIDLLQIHRFDPSTPIEETMKALHDLVQTGKVRYIGASSMWATEFAQMQFIAEKNGWTKFISVQNYYNPCYREEEREMNRFCKATGVGILPWSPLYGGKLAKPWGQKDTLRSQMPDFLEGPPTEDEQIITRVEEISKKRGLSMAHVALLWHKVKGTVPIVGLSSIQRIIDLEELKGAILSDEDVKFIDEPYKAREVVGHS